MGQTRNHNKSPNYPPDPTLYNPDPDSQQLGVTPNTAILSLLHSGTAIGSNLTRLILNSIGCKSCFAWKLVNSHGQC